MNLIDFTKLDCTVETYGRNLILRMGIKQDAPVSREYLSRAVCTLLNYGAIDFIPENGGREYENLRPYNAVTDDYVLLQTNTTKLRRALDIHGYVNLAWATELLCPKRDKTKPKARKVVSPFWKEVQANGLDAQKAAFKPVTGDNFYPSPAAAPYQIGTI